MKAELVSAERHRRELAVWLAQLATYRQGLVRRLLMQERDAGPSGSDAAAPPLDRLLERTAHELERRIAARSRNAGHEGKSVGGEGERFAALLSQGPAELPPGDRWELTDQATAGSVNDVFAVTWCDELYPAKLRQIDDPPPALFVRGCCAPESLRCLDKSPVVAIVGSRSPSPYGLEMTSCLARGLALAGLTVISGLAMGIDAAAQDEALRALAGSRVPATVGVLGCGADIVYPRSNRALYERTLRHGLLVSEFELGAAPRSWRFPARNRVIAALADAVIVVEGTVRSGSLHTAGFAVDAGRDVFAVPGEAGRRLSAGPHKLLRLGAGLCEGPSDVLEVLLPGWGRTPATEDPGDQPLVRRAEGSETGRCAGHDPEAPAQGRVSPSGPEQRVLQALTDCELTTDGLAARCTLSVAEVSAALAALEIEGVIRTAPGGLHCVVRH